MAFLLSIIVLCMYEWLFGRSRQQQIETLEASLVDALERVRALERSLKPVQERAVDAEKAARAPAPASAAAIAAPAPPLEPVPARAGAEAAPAAAAGPSPAPGQYIDVLSELLRAAPAAAGPSPAPPAMPVPRPAPVPVPAAVTAAVAQIAMTPSPGAATTAHAGSTPFAAAPVMVTPAPPPSVEISAADTRPAKSIEENIVDWFAKFGAVFVFLALAALTAYVWNRIPIFGRVALFIAAGAATLGSGVMLEKRERYLILGRSLIGSGWATLFMTAFAMYHVEQIRVIGSLEADLLLVLCVTAAMVWHTLRYESQLVTGLAFGLAFYTVAQSHVSAWSLLASVMLAAGLVTIVLQRRWYELEIFGILASYGNHALWLWPLVEANRLRYGHNVMFPQFAASIAVLTFYWATFRASYAWRDVKDKAPEAVSTVAAVLNTVLLLGVAYYQSLGNKNLAFWAILTLGAVELAVARLARLRARRRTAFLLLSTLGWILVVAAAPVRFAGSGLVILWLVTAEAFLFAGIWENERPFRWLGIVTSLLAGGYLACLIGMPLFNSVLDGTRRQDPQLAIVFGFAALVFYFNAHVVPRWWRPAFDCEDGIDQSGLALLSYFAGLMVVCASYSVLPPHWVGVGLGLAVCAVTWCGMRFTIDELIYQAHPIVAVAALDVILMNGQVQAPVRMLSFAALAGLLYLSSRFVRLFKRQDDFDWMAGAAYTWVASFLLVMLGWFRFQDSRTAVVWAAFATALALVAGRLRLRRFWMQAHVLSAAVVLRALMFNMQDTGTAGGWMSARLITVIGVAALLYAIAYLVHRSETAAIGEGRRAAEDAASARQISQIYTWGAGALLALLAFYETADWRTGLVWAGFALLLGWLGRQLKRAELNVQSLILAALAAGAALTVNVRSGELLGGVVSVALLSVGAIAAILYVLHHYSPEEELKPLYIWGGSLLLTWLMWYQLPPLSIALAWTLFGLVVFEIGITRPSAIGSSLRAQGYVAAIAGFTRVLIVNINATQSLWYSALPIAPLLFFMYAEVTRSGAAVTTGERQLRTADVLAFLGTITVATVLKFMLPPDWVVLAWAVMATVLAAVALITSRDLFRLQALLGILPVVVRGLMFNVYETHLGSLGSGPALAVFAAVFALMLALPFAYRMRDPGWVGQNGDVPGDLARIIWHRPEQVFFFSGAGVLTVLFAYLLPGVSMTLAWGVEAAVIIVLALGIGERSFRLSAIGLLLACVAKVLAYDVWHFDNTLARIVTLIAIGLILLSVSFLYGRYREKIHELL